MTESVSNGEWFPCWAVVRPSDDGSGTWIAHCLDYDVVTFGDSPEQVIQDIGEMVGEVILDDLNRNAVLVDRRAPAEEWQVLRRILRHGKALQRNEIDAYVADTAKMPNCRPILAMNFGIAVGRVAMAGERPRCFEPERQLMVVEANAA